MKVFGVEHSPELSQLSLAFAMLPSPRHHQISITLERTEARAPQALRMPSFRAVALGEELVPKKEEEEVITTETK